jgi:hypothetical protein
MALSHPADRAILFSEKKDCKSQDTELTQKAHGRLKKDIKAILAKHVFEHDAHYSHHYAANPGKFSTAVQSRLTMCVSARLRELH